MRSETLDYFGVHAVRRSIAILDLALRVDPLVNDRGRESRPSHEHRAQKNAFHFLKILANSYRAREPASPVRIRTA